MAIIKTFSPHIDICILNDKGNPTRERMDTKALPLVSRQEQDAPITQYITKCIEAVPNAGFGIFLRVQSSYEMNYPCLEFRIIFNGIEIASKFLGKTMLGTNPPGKPWKAVLRGAGDGGMESSSDNVLLGPTSFKYPTLDSCKGNIPLSSFAEDSKQPFKVGEISVKLYRRLVACQGHDTVRAKSVKLEESEQPQEKEQGRQARLHGHSREDSLAFSKQSVLRRDANPMVVFRFKYTLTETLPQPAARLRGKNIRDVHYISALLKAESEQVTNQNDTQHEQDEEWEHYHIPIFKGENEPLVNQKGIKRE
ncbi:hypothetical protein B0J14DRAFT_664885 [Halenospora varia]|nr:hypothetical protein B0J14DRAFT_664885 [Halenospora varia]